MQTNGALRKKEKKQYHQYHHFYKVYQDMLESTNAGIAPWHVVDASYLDEASAFFFETVINTIQSSASQLENKTWPILMPSDTYPTLKARTDSNGSSGTKYQMMIMINN